MRCRGIALTATFAFFIFVPFSGYAAVDENRPLIDDLSPQYNRTEEIAVSPKRGASPLKSTAEDVIIFTQDDIRKLPARDLGELLVYVPGVDMKVTNQFGQPTSITIHGSDSRQVLVMVDGIPFNTQLSGQANPAKIPIEDIARVEVIRGASSSAWGSSLGGVINVITKDTGTTAVPHGRLTTSFAEFATTRNSLELDGAVRNLGYYLFGSYFDTDGPRPQADAKDNKMFGKVSYRLTDEANLVGSFGYTGADTSDFYYDPFSGHINDTRKNFTRYGQLQVNVDEPERSFHAAAKYNNQDINTDLRFLDFSSISRTISSDVYYGLTLDSNYKIREDDLLVVGTDFSWTMFKTNSSLKTGKSVSQQAPYANYTLRLDNWDFIPGLRYDHNQQFGSQVSPSFGTVYHFEDPGQTLVRARASRAFNAPPMLWIYQSTGSTLANPDLKPERGVVYETGVETSLATRLRGELNLYWDDIKDAITSATVSGKTQKVNVNKFRRRGAEAMLRYTAVEGLMFYTGAGYNDPWDVGADKLVRDQGMARTSFSFGMDYQSKNKFGCHLAGYYDRWLSSPSMQANDRKPIFDAKFTKGFTGLPKNLDLEAFFNIHNITNSKYWSSLTFPLPQRYFEGGLSLHF